MLDALLIGRGRRRDGRGRARHRAPRPAQRAREHGRQELRPDLPRVRGRARPVVGAGLGRREVPRRLGRHPPRAVGRKIVVTLASNPSHLEAVDPVVEGMARAKGDRMRRPTSARRCCPVLVHGDAAFAGQGVVAETLNLSEVPGYEVGGTVHIVVNNQLGFTTAPELGRSGVYATDVAKMVQAPIFHVNGDDPEACVRVVRARVRVPPGVPQGRRRRHGLLPPVRPQRGRRARVHPAADVRADPRQAQHPQALHRDPREPRRPHARPGRGDARRLPRPARPRVRGDPLVGPAHDPGEHRGARGGGDRGRHRRAARSARADRATRSSPRPTTST